MIGMNRSLMTEKIFRLLERLIATYEVTCCTLVAFFVASEMAKSA